VVPLLRKRVQLSRILPCMGPGGGSGHRLPGRIGQASGAGAGRKDLQSVFIPVPGHVQRIHGLQALHRPAAVAGPGLHNEGPVRKGEGVVQHLLPQPVADGKLDVPGIHAHVRQHRHEPEPVGA